MDVHDREHEFELSTNALDDSEHVSDENRDAIQTFINKCLAEGLSTARASKYTSSMHTILKMAPDDFTLLDADQEDLETVVARINQASSYSEWTRADFRTALKKFYKVMEGDGREYPDKVQFFSTQAKKNKTELPDPLDKEEIDAIIEACTTDRDRAMYKVLYEGGIRAGELLNLRIKDVSFTDKGVKINVRGKTGNRKILLVESERYLRTWLSKHPFKDRRDAPLWVNVHNTADTPAEAKLRYDNLRLTLKKRAKEAGIRPTTTENGRETADVYPHLFRHTRATHLAMEMTEAAMKEYFGWTQNSDMPAKYIHLSGRDIDKEIMRIYGVEPDEPEPEQQECSRCLKTYKGNEQYCPRCGAPLDAVTAMEQTRVEDAAEAIADQLLHGDLDEDGLKELVQEVQD